MGKELKYHLSPRGMVLYIFAMYAGQPFSIKDIQEKILKHFEYNISWRTIVAAIDEGDTVTGNIVQSEERRGLLNLPVQVFTIIYKNQDN